LEKEGQTQKKNVFIQYEKKCKTKSGGVPKVLQVRALWVYKHS